MNGPCRTTLNTGLSLVMLPQVPYYRYLSFSRFFIHLIILSQMAWIFTLCMVVYGLKLKARKTKVEVNGGSVGVWVAQSLPQSVRHVGLWEVWSSERYPATCKWDLYA